MPPRIHDISLPITPDLALWPGDPPIEIERVADIASGDAFTVTRFAATAHLGTHVDAPAHCLPGGAGVEALALDRLVGPARLLDVGGVDRIDRAVLEALDLPPGPARLLFRTRNSAAAAAEPSRFRPDYVGIAGDAAAWLVERGTRLVGIDGPSIAPMDELEEPHRTLLGAGIVVVEGLALAAVPPGDYLLVCLPLKLVGADGAPCRAILVESDGVRLP